MISAANSSCRAEAEPAAEDDAEAEAEAGRVHGEHHYRRFFRITEATEAAPKMRIPKHGTKSVITYRASLSSFFNASFSWVPRNWYSASVLSEPEI